MANTKRYSQLAPTHKAKVDAMLERVCKKIADLVIFNECIEDEDKKYRIFDDFTGVEYRVYAPKGFCYYSFRDEVKRRMKGTENEIYLSKRA